ncbi:MAG: RidA family protein [Mycobacteriales bacterium]
MTTEIVNPPELPANPAFAQGTLSTGSRILVVGGQNGVDATGAMAAGLAAQTAQALRNVLAVLEAAGAGPAQVARLGVYLVASVDPAEAFAAVGPEWRRQPTAVVVLRVAGLARPDALVEIEALAVL